MPREKNSLSLDDSSISRKKPYIFTLLTRNIFLDIEENT